MIKTSDVEAYTPPVLAWIGGWIVSMVVPAVGWIAFGAAMIWLCRRIALGGPVQRAGALWLRLGLLVLPSLLPVATTILLLVLANDSIGVELFMLFGIFTAPAALISLLVSTGFIISTTARYLGVGVPKSATDHGLN